MVKTTATGACGHFGMTSLGRDRGVLWGLISEARRVTEVWSTLLRRQREDEKKTRLREWCDGAVRGACVVWSGVLMSPINGRPPTGVGPLLLLLVRLVRPAPDGGPSSSFLLHRASARPAPPSRAASPREAASEQPVYQDPAKQIVCGFEQPPRSPG